jgi:PEP-CTERM motif
VTFSGGATTCLFDPNLQACSSGPIATINFNSAGTATLNYTQQGGVWSLTSATFTLSPVPEPGTFLLMGSGITALLGVVRCRRSKAEQD